VNPADPPRPAPARPYPNPSPAASVRPPATNGHAARLAWLAGSGFGAPGGLALAGHVLPRRAAGGPARGEGCAPARSGGALARPSSGPGNDALRGAWGGVGRSPVQPAAAGAAAVLPSRRVHGGRGWRPLQVASLT